MNIQSCGSHTIIKTSTNSSYRKRSRTSFPRERNQWCWNRTVFVQIWICFSLLTSGCWWKRVTNPPYDSASRTSLFKRMRIRSPRILSDSLSNLEKSLGIRNTFLLVLYAKSKNQMAIVVFYSLATVPLTTEEFPISWPTSWSVTKRAFKQLKAQSILLKSSQPRFPRKEIREIRVSLQERGAIVDKQSHWKIGLKLFIIPPPPPIQGKLYPLMDKAWILLEGSAFPILLNGGRLL